MTPLLTEEQMKETAAKYEEFLKAQGAEIVHQENWGLRKLAYPIQKKSTGFYHLIEFKAEPNVVDLYELEFRRDEKIMRFLTVKEDKHMIEYNDKRKRGEVGNRKKIEGQGAPAKI